MSIWSGITSGIGSYFSSGSGWSDILRGVMGGVAAAGASSSAQRQDKLDFTQAKELVGLEGEQALLRIGAMGQEDRRKSLYEKQLDEIFMLRDNDRKRVALDTYGQFNTIQRWAPDYVKPAAPAVPSIPDYK